MSAISRDPGATMGGRVGFWLLAAVLAFLLFAASAPSPLYPVYAARWGFSATTLTAIFAVYALALLVALLTTGELSDHLGRRPVLAGALLVQIGSMVVFVLADGVAALYLARVLQGAGTGIATAAISAWLLDLEPRRALGGVVGSIAPMVGLATGAVGAGLLVQYGPHPLRLVYWLLAAVFLSALVALPFVGDEVPRSPGWLTSLRPQIGVPRAARPLFVASMPSLIATWSLGGLYLSLGPSLANDLRGGDSRLAGGLVIAALAGAGALAATITRSLMPRKVVIGGSLVLIAGVGVTLVAVATASAPGLYAGSLIAGLGFGPAFSGVFRSLAPLVEPHERAALLASIYVVSYLAFSVPAVLAGVGAAHWSLRPTTYVYCATVMALAAATVMAIARPGGRLEARDREGTRC